MSETWQTHWVYPCSDVQDVVILYLSDTYNRYIIFLIIFTRVFDRQVRLYGRTRKAVEETLRIPDVHFDLIPLVNLVSNRDNQRDLSESHITKTIREFDVYQINPVKVSHRDWQNYVFDGQHTIEMIASISESRDTPVTSVS